MSEEKLCLICSKSLSGLKPNRFRVLCEEPACRAEHNRRKTKAAYVRRHERKGNVPDVTVAPKYRGPERRQGFFLIPDRQVELLRDGPKAFCCQCGALPSLNNDLRIECSSCGALWTISLGKRHDGKIYITNAERWR